MPSERAISQMVDIFTDVIDLGGVEERTAIVPNLSVIDAAPTGLTNFVIVQDDRDGDNILAKTVPGVVYANNDKVNVLFIRGTEPIAFQQGSESSNAGLWEIVPSTSTDIFYDKGNVAIGTSTPDALALLEIESTGGGLLTRIIGDNAGGDVTLALINIGDSNIDTTLELESRQGTRFGGKIVFGRENALAWSTAANADGFISLNPVLNNTETERMRVTSAGDVGIGTTGPDAKLDVLATTTQLRLTHTDGSVFADFTLDTNHDLTITPSSTGQIILQPTTDSTDFFQVLDANGGTPVLNVDSTNERVGVGILAPTQLFTVSRNTAGGSPIIRLSLADTSVAVNEIFGRIESFGNDTQASGVAGAIRWLAESTISSAATFDSQFIISTTVDGSETDRLWVKSSGRVGIGIGAPLGRLHVDQASTTAAIPVAYFDQADVSEEIFEFASTIGVGNAIEAVGAKTLTTTHFIKVTIPGGLTRYFPVGTIA